MAGVGREAGHILAGGERSGRDMWPLNKHVGTLSLVSKMKDLELYELLTN
jgi:hypothetical protein